MHFEPNTIYHIYNQGNNREKIFFKHSNYQFFLKKFQDHILPHVKLLAYCLMPNHFHWLVLAKESACDWIEFPNAKAFPRQRLHHQINILLRSYTRAINNQENRSGSLFRQHTKAKDGWGGDYFTAKNQQKYTFGTGNNYALQCFHYIHDNPVKGNLTNTPSDWEYSSASDYAGLRKGTLCDLELANLLLFHH